MIFKCKVPAVVLLVIFGCLSCNDDLDEVYQATDKIVRSKLIKSIIVDSYDMESPKTYNFNYTEENYLESFTNGNSDPVKMTYNKDDGSLVNLEEVAAKIFYSDLIFKIPYDYDKFIIYLKETNKQGDPTLIKLLLIKDGEVRTKYVKTAYDQTLNNYRPYLMAGGLIVATDQSNSQEGREQFFKSKFVPSKKPSNITYLDQNGKQEHMYFAEYQYNEKQLVTRGEVTYFNIISGDSPEVTFVLFSYMDSAIK